MSIFSLYVPLLYTESQDRPEKFGALGEAQPRSQAIPSCGDMREEPGSEVGLGEALCSENILIKLLYFNDSEFPAYTLSN
jgi:hypothetical protein